MRAHHAPSHARTSPLHAAALCLLGGCFQVGTTDRDRDTDTDDPGVLPTDTDTDPVDTDTPWQPSCAGTLTTPSDTVDACPASTVTVRGWDGTHADLTFTLGDGACSLRLDLDDTCGTGAYWRAQAVRFDWAAGTCGLPARTDDAVVDVRALSLQPHDGVVRVDLDVVVTLRAPGTGDRSTGTMQLSVEVPDPTTPGTFRACSNARDSVVRDAGVDHDVDVLFVVQDDATMAPFTQRLADAAPALVDLLDARADGWRVGVVTTDMTTPEASGRLQGTDTALFVDATTPDVAVELAALLDVGTSGVSPTRGLQAARNAAAMPTVPLFQANRDFFRSDAELVIAFVTSADDVSGGAETPSTLAAWMAGARAHPALARASALTGPDPSGCGTILAGSRYNEVARLTGGVSRSLCDDPVTRVLDALSGWPGSLVLLPDDGTVLPASLEVVATVGGSDRALDRSQWTWTTPYLAVAPDALLGAERLTVSWAVGP
ncbi:MAG: hypothetical protein H6733_00820 [Alphaproteobacteria bacterium]|nr:hypothetical protein [Alphaproteobacteria bacterium]